MNDGGPLKAAVRRIAVSSFINAHREVITIEHQKAAFAAVGFVPFNPMIILENQFVQPGRGPEQQARFTINGWQVTAPECLSAIRDYQISRQGPMTTPIDPTEFQLTSLQAPQTEGRLLAHFESRLIIADDGTIRLQRFT